MKRPGMMQVLERIHNLSAEAIQRPLLNNAPLHLNLQFLRITRHRKVPENIPDLCLGSLYNPTAQLEQVLGARVSGCHSGLTTSFQRLLWRQLPHASTMGCLYRRLSQGLKRLSPKKPEAFPLLH